MTNTHLLQIDLPWPPSVNHYYRRVGHKTLISAEGRKYRELVKALVLGHCVIHRSPVPIKDRLSVTIQAHPPDRRKRDLDNLFKSVLDSLQHAGVYEDDGQIDALMVTRFPLRTPEGGITVIVNKFQLWGADEP